MNKRGEHFNSALLAIVLSISVVSLAFLSENRSLTGFVAYEEQEFVPVSPNLLVFDNVDSLSTLSAGNYYIDGNGIVYWADDSSMPAIARVSSIAESQENRKIHIDNEGNVGYLLE
ncbi:MAG: hypothetical protein HYW23_04740 [Candidatus Aenigmarchaeota archaeon]|nr:hypothetical protein [Candidatus Aenigmarchaeota archaeon]